MQINARAMTGAVISRLKHDEEISIPTAHTVLCEGDYIQAVGPFIREEAELHMLFPPPLHGRGVMEMVTYSDLFQLGILIVNIITLVVQINKKTK